MRKKFLIIVVFLLCVVIAPSQVNSAAKKTAAPKGNIDSQIEAEEKKRSELSKQIQNYRKQ
ncbi:MAG: hypothetical protein IJU31_01325, partial [Synergistaceae bacterium]|nr:hypothetical protein [Synergistaceae bacterium]